MSAPPSPLTSTAVSASVADPARLAAVSSYRLAGHDAVAELDALVAHMARTLDVPIALINLVSPDLQCYPAEHGVGVPRTHVHDEVSFCAHVVTERAPMTVADARTHPVFAANPLVRTGSVAAYAGVPLIDEDGFVLGALSVFDGAPRTFTDGDQQVLHTLAGLVRVVLSLRRRAAAQAWTGRLLAAQGRALEQMATGRPLATTLDLLAATARDLAPDADQPQLQVLRSAVDRLSALATEAARWRNDTERMARQDPLTGLANRSCFTESGAAALAGGGAVLFIDLDRFKDVNDRGGHALGDQLLVRLAGALRERVTTVVPGAVIGRLGGDEFAVVLPATDHATAAELGEDLLHVLTDEVRVGRRTILVSCSIGVASAPPHATFDDVLRAADSAMYAAKDAGRGRVRTVSCC
ncbi:diguanylate cyclase domain-containing protein [Blastococcus sp. SYSU DS0533]